MNKNISKRLVLVAKALEKLGGDYYTKEKGQVRINFPKVENISRFRNLIRRLHPDAVIKIIHNTVFVKNIPMNSIDHINDVAMRSGGKPEGSTPYEKGD